MNNKITGVLGVMIAKKESTRLPNKNTLEFHGVPLYKWNLKKMLTIFETVVFDSDCQDMLKGAEQMGAEPHLRVNSLCGNEVPSVPIFLSILEKNPQFEFIVNVQANSPNVESKIIYNAGLIMKHSGIDELLTMYSDRSINGSIWGFSRDRLTKYGDYYTHHPDVLILDDSIDIHTNYDFNEASIASKKN